MGKSRPSLARRIKRTEYFRKKRERKIVAVEEQAKEYLSAYVQSCEISSKRALDLEDTKKELLASEKRVKEAVQVTEDNILGLVKERWRCERDIFEKIGRASCRERG